MANHRSLGFVWITTIAIATVVPSHSRHLRGQDRICGLPHATRSEVIARHGMAATSQPLATQVAVDILQQGGSAVDAAIAANAVLGLMEPTGCGIGGDLFAMVWDAKSAKLHGLNGSGRSPASLTLDEILRRGHQHIPPHGPLPITVPGCVDGWFDLHEKFGRLPMREVLAPAIRYAREGFPVSELIAHYWASGKVLARFPGFADTFLPGGEPPRKGTLFRNPALADTLERIANGGRDEYYRGATAERIAKFVQEQGGFLSVEDLSTHQSDWVEPISARYRNCEVWELPPNGQGLAALQMLRLLENVDLAAVKFGSPDHVHYFVESKKLAFEDRARWYADSNFFRTPVSGLLSDEYTRSRFTLIHARHASTDVRPGNPVLDQGDTIYLTTADQDRNMVSLIQSNYRGFGSGLCPPGLGFCLHDRGELFSLDANHPNAYAPRKRPFHTIIPAFVTRNGKPWISFGVMGGATQPQGHVQIVLNLVDFGMNLQEAGDAPRILHNGSSEPTGEVMIQGGTVALERGFDPATLEELERRGHRLKPDPGQFGGYQAIMYDAVNDVLIGASESRKDGQAAGY